MKYFEIVEFNTNLNCIVKMRDCSNDMDFIKCSEHTFLIKDNVSGNVFRYQPYMVQALKVVPEIWKSTNGMPDVLRFVGCMFLKSQNYLMPNNTIHVDVSGGDRMDVRDEFSIYQLSEPQCWYMTMTNVRKHGIAK